MSESREDGHYEAPIRALAGTRAGARRARIATVVAVALLGGAIALAIAPSAGQPLPPRVRSPDIAERASATPAPTRGGQPDASGGVTSRRVEALADLPDRPLSGSPSVILVERWGADARIVRWTAGHGFTTDRTIDGAFANLDENPVFPILAPASDRLLMLSIVGSEPPGDHGRLVDASGTVLWKGDGLTALSGAVWSPDGRLVVAAGTGGTWRLIIIDPSGGTARARVVTLPAASIPIPSPNDRVGPIVVTPRTLPLGFSADGRWVYGGVVSPQLATITAVFRVATDGSRAEAARTLGVGRPDGLAPALGTLGGRLVDPTTGRIAEWRTNNDFSGGPPSIEVRNADGSYAYVVDVGTPLGSAWDDEGHLYVLAADAIVFPDETRLVRVGPAGTSPSGAPIYETGPVAHAGLIGLRDGFAALVVSINRPSSGSQLVLVDLTDPARRAAIQLLDENGGSIAAVDLRP